MLISQIDADSLSFSRAFSSTIITEVPFHPKIHLIKEEASLERAGRRLKESVCNEIKLFFSLGIGGLAYLQFIHIEIT